MATASVAGLVLIAVIIPVVKAAARVITVCVALRGVDQSHRAAVLRALAEVHRWWRWRR